MSANGWYSSRPISSPFSITHQTLWIKQLRRITKPEAVMGHVLEGEFDRVECFIVEKAFDERDRVAVLRR
jgi:hypothetical protein